MIETLQIAVSARDHLRGFESAPITLVEYGDFACPFCSKSYPAIHELLNRYRSSLRFVFRHNPRREAHPGAHLAAQAAEAAALQGQFWAMHDLLFERGVPISDRIASRYALELELDVERFQKDLHSREVARRVREDEVGGLRSGVIGTPAFFINGLHFYDKPDFDTLSRALDLSLALRDNNPPSGEWSIPQPSAARKT